MRKPTETWVVASKLAYPGLGISKIRDIDKYKYLVTFSTKQDMDESLEAGRDLFLEVFDEIIPWTVEEVAVARRFWLECRGVPLHGWSNQNFRKIGEVWGNFVCCDSNTSQAESFEAAKILIDSTCFQFIKGWVSLILEGKIFDIHVMEVEREGFQLSTRSKCDTKVFF